jgi:hypothetical protein
MSPSVFEQVEITKLAPRKDATVFKVGGGWGDSIQWSFGGEGFPCKVNGWKTPKPIEGDVLTCEMQSGRTCVWIFAKVEPCRDVHDMFFADVELAGYLDELSESAFPMLKTTGK